MHQVIILNYSRLRSVPGVGINQRYCTAREIADALQAEIDDAGLPARGYVSVPYKYKPELRAGEAIFRFVGEKQGAYYFSFQTTVTPV